MMMTPRLSNGIRPLAQVYRPRSAPRCQAGQVWRLLCVFLLPIQSGINKLPRHDFKSAPLLGLPSAELIKRISRYRNQNLLSLLHDRPCQLQKHLCFSLSLNWSHHAPCSEQPHAHYLLAGYVARCCHISGVKGEQILLWFLDEEDRACFFSYTCASPARLWLFTRCFINLIKLWRLEAFPLFLQWL